jgi:hypothetical protein
MDYYYYEKYLKYKKKYLQLRGGYIDELKYKEKLKYSTLKNVKYIGGPVSKYILRGPGREIQLYGDYHDAARKLDCGLDLVNNLDDENKIIYFTDYLEYYFKRNKEENIDEVIDVFMEFQYIGKEAKELQYKNGMLNNVYEYFKDCYRSLVDREKCYDRYLNVRFHAADPRGIYEGASMIFNIHLMLQNEKINLENLLEHINFATKTYIPAIHVEYINFFVNTMNMIRNNIEESIFVLKLIRYDSQKYLKKYNKNIRAIKKLLDTLQKFLKHIIGNKHIDFSKIDYDNIREINDIIDFYIKVPDLYNKIFVIIDLYYTKETKEILTKDMTDEELENILYNNIYQLEKIKKDFDSINDLNIKKQLEQYFRDRIKIYINKYDINNYIKNLRKVLEQKKEFSELINENIKILSVIELQYSIMVMDFYLLSRLLKKYRYDSTKKINQDYTKNIIIAAGHFHIVEYVKFFKDYLNYNLIYEENKLVDLLIKDAPDIKDYIKLDIPVSWKRQERYRKKQNEYNTAIKQYVEEHENLLNKKCVKI